MKNMAAAYGESGPVTERLLQHDLAFPPSDINADLVGLLDLDGSEMVVDGATGYDCFPELLEAHNHQGDILAFDLFANIEDRPVVPSPRVTYRKGDLRDMHFLDDKSVDVFTLRRCLTHLTDKGRQRVYREILRTQKEDGKTGVITTGEGNRAILWEVVEVHAKALEVEPPKKINQDYPPETAMAELREHFGYVCGFEYRGFIPISSSFETDIALGAVRSLMSECTPVPDEAESEAVLQTKTRERLVEIARERGPLERSKLFIVLASNKELNARKLKRMAAELNLVYQRAS